MKCEVCNATLHGASVLNSGTLPGINVRYTMRLTQIAEDSVSVSELIDARINSLQDWRGALLARLRHVIRKSDQAIVETWKWNVPVWTCHGIICTGETYKKAVKLTFAKGASLDDPSHLFNASMEGRVRRAIDFPQEAGIDEEALMVLVQAAIRLNQSSRS